jgi:DNA repair exonuclease SbcCD ATPase subunit
MEKQNEILLQNLERLKATQIATKALKEKLEELNEKIKELELENINLREKTKQKSDGRSYISTLEEKIVEYDDKISNLEKINKLHRETIDKLRAQQKSEDGNNKNDKLISELKEENSVLHQEIEELNNVNALHRETIEKLRSESASLPHSEEKIETLTKTISDLTKENEDLRKKLSPPVSQTTLIENFEEKIERLNTYIASMENENMELREKLDAMSLEHKETDLEQNILRLQKNIAELEKQNSDLEEKNQLLKAALLLHVDSEASEVNNIGKKPTTIGIPKVSEEKIQEVVSEVKEDVEAQELTSERPQILQNTTEEIPDPLSEIPKGRVQEIIKQRHAALEEQEGKKEQELSVIEQESKEVDDFKLKQGASILSTQIEKPEPDEDKDEVDSESFGIIETIDGRRKCPICGNQNHRLIREVEDKTKIISAYPRMYGKKYKCGQCGAEWR